MAKNLVVVESPAKAKTIEKFLGPDFLVASSFGHIADLPKKGLGIDLEKNFEPNYEISADKQDVVKKLKKQSKKAETIWLATDEDREGEAIAWHLFEFLNLTKEKTKRIVFHEITKTAIKNAVENPREIDYNLVNAQQARRVLDRLVGFEISPVLWKKIKTGLSAGRVQSVALRLIAEREAEIQAFVSTSFYRVKGLFLTNEKAVFQAQLDVDFQDEHQTQSFLKDCAKAIFSVRKTEKKPAKRSPSPPFTTSTLQQEAARKFGFSVSQTMQLAQRLYEAGHITYMRTDSLNLSNDALAWAKDQIVERFSDNYTQPRTYTTKTKGAQEAHEAIRPTNFAQASAGADATQKKLYELIWKRTLASQMKDAQLERTTISIENNLNERLFVAKGEVIVFDGFLALYNEVQEDEPEDQETKLLPKVTKGDKLTYNTIEAKERYTKHAPRFSEAMLVKKMEDLGIGRPSTYAPTISTIQKRQYVEKLEREGKEQKYKHFILDQNKDVNQTIGKEIVGKERGKLSPTDVGLVVNGFLVEHFPDILDYGFTATVEEHFDEIAKGKEKWNKMISTFYKPFHNNVVKVSEEADRSKGERLIGVDPKTQKNVYARIGRYGPMVQIGESSDEEKPLFASLRKDQHIGTLSLEQALDLFKLPRNVGVYQEKEIVSAIGRFGPYLKFDGGFVSIRGLDPLEISLQEAIEHIEAHREKEKNKYIKVFQEADPVIEICNGRYGPYIKQGKNNYKIPKDKDPKALDLEEVKAIIASAVKKPSKSKKTRS